MLIFLTDINGLGLQTAQGLLFTESFYWDLNDSTRERTKRFLTHLKNYPTSNQAAAYSATLRFPKAMDVPKPHDGAQLVAQMKAMPTDDPVLRKGPIRGDGRKLHPIGL